MIFYDKIKKYFYYFKHFRISFFFYNEKMNYSNLENNYNLNESNYNYEIKKNIITEMFKNGYKNINDEKNILKLKEELYNFMYNIYSIKNFFLVSKDDIYELFKKDRINPILHKKISEIILSYQNNRLYKPFYKYIVDIPKNIKYYTGYSKNESFMNSSNIKHFIMKLKYDYNDNYIYYFNDSFMTIKTFKIDFNDKKNFIDEYIGFLFEAMMGMKYINQLKDYLPNFAYTYSYSECSEFFMKLDDNENIKIKTWCNKTIHKDRLYPYITKEGLENTISLSDFLKNNSINNFSNKLYEILLQFKNAIATASYLLKCYENRGLNLDNLRLYKYGKGNEIDIPIYEFNYELKQIGSLKTRYLLIIENHSNCKINNDFYYKNNNNIVNYSTLLTYINEYFKSINQFYKINFITLEAIYNYSNLIDTTITTYNVKKNIIIKFLYDKKSKIWSKSMNYCTYGNPKYETFKEDFIKYINGKIKFFNDKIDNSKIISIEELIILCEKYIKFISILLKSNCIKYTEILHDNYIIKQKLEILLKNNKQYNNNITEDLLYTITMLNNELPESNYIISMFGNINLFMLSLCLAVILSILCIFLIYPDLLNGIDYKNIILNFFKEHELSDFIPDMLETKIDNFIKYMSGLGNKAYMFYLVSIFVRFLATTDILFLIFISKNFLIMIPFISFKIIIMIITDIKNIIWLIVMILAYIISLAISTISWSFKFFLKIISILFKKLISKNNIFTSLYEIFKINVRDFRDIIYGDSNQIKDYEKQIINLKNLTYDNKIKYINERIIVSVDSIQEKIKDYEKPNISMNVY